MLHCEEMLVQRLVVQCPSRPHTSQRASCCPLGCGGYGIRLLILVDGPVELLPPGLAGGRRHTAPGCLEVVEGGDAPRVVGREAQDPDVGDLRPVVGEFGTGHRSATGRPRDGGGVLGHRRSSLLVVGLGACAIGTVGPVRLADRGQRASCPHSSVGN